MPAFVRDMDPWEPQRKEEKVKIFLVWFCHSN